MQQARRDILRMAHRRANTSAGKKANTIRIALRRAPRLRHPRPLPPAQALRQRLLPRQLRKVLPVGNLPQETKSFDFGRSALYSVWPMKLPSTIAAIVLLFGLSSLLRAQTDPASDRAGGFTTQPVISGAASSYSDRGSALSNEGSGTAPT